ncbi:hypothetical protein O7634_29775 [Micromonospora sp. WMMD1120]|uniref:hypothetical protein n=1 Tax=Micromonospora sp. WMMD1120 TaxID=3016106 RepID=UPI0024180F79|nr:hypothetical protein [Micromonospora sp. WMMD1120]MDG4810968.1 hypothetical protein [Micromonospora sp. WMMD1120]
MAVIFGLLMLFTALSQGDTIGLVLGAVLVGGGAFLLTRSGASGGVRKVGAGRTS